MAARLAVHRESAMRVAEWLAAQPEVAEVLYPPMPGAQGHEIWKRDFDPKYACGLMGARFHDDICRQQVAALIDSTDLFGIGFSWGGYESLILPTDPSRVRNHRAAQWTAPMIRLHVGLECVEDLISDLQQGFDALREQARLARAA
jgi:cystathionine beta-lyase